MLGGDGRMTQIALGHFASNVGNDLFVGRESARVAEISDLATRRASSPAS
jgi:hypothetical protein